MGHSRRYSANSAQLRLRLARYFLKKQSDQGLTLLELLVVVIIMGMLAALVIPSMLNQAAKARQAEAKQVLGTINRGQQGYRIENAQFATEVSILGLGVDADSENYLYSHDGTPANEGQFAAFDNNPAFGVRIKAVAKDQLALLDYDAAALAKMDDAGGVTTSTILCRAAQADETAEAGIQPGSDPAVLMCVEGASLN
jgi:prepilin-type N-terminal cleavage/methylation domain-containing protein